ncbi:MAG TPA: hypothetical protein VMC79_01635, partial [Rectinemataceae bacterium]|nr:hypothetical protein [Rectinemataceae bacterium]
MKRCIASILCMAALVWGSWAQETPNPGEATLPPGPVPMIPGAAPQSADADGGTGSAASGTAPTINLQDFLAAAQSTAPALRSARLSLDNAAAQLAVSAAANGLTLSEKAAYYHEGSLSSSSTAASSTVGSAGTGVEGDNLQAGLTLAGPSTTLGIGALQGFASSGPVAGSTSTALDVSGSQVVYDG